MMINGWSVLLVLAVLVLVGFIGGAVASIWFGSIAMLWGAIGLPVVCILLILAWILFNVGAEDFR